MGGNSGRPIRESTPEAIALPIDPEEIAGNEAMSDGMFAAQLLRLHEQATGGA